MKVPNIVVPLVKRGDKYAPLFVKVGESPIRHVPANRFASSDQFLFVAMKIGKRNTYLGLVHDMIEIYLENNAGKVFYPTNIVNKIYDALLIYLPDVVFSRNELYAFVYHLYDKEALSVASEELAKAIMDALDSEGFMYIINAKEKFVKKVDEKPVEKAAERLSEEVDDFFFIEPSVNAVLSAAFSLSKGGYVNVLLTGPSGYGKTSIARKFAEKIGYGFVEVDVSLLSEPSELFGQLRLKSGSTEFVETPFVNAITKGKHVICFDEINRAYPNLLNPLLGLLDDGRSVTFGDKVYSVAKDTIFIATANIGAGYTGTFRADVALMNRMSLIAIVGQGITPDDEAKIYAKTGLNIDQIKMIVVVLSACRQNKEFTLDFSIRTGYTLCKLVKLGFTIRSAFLTVFATMSEEERKMLIDVLGRYGHLKADVNMKLIF